MTTLPRQIVARLLGASLLGLAILGLEASAGHAGTVPNSNPSVRLIADDPPADDGADDPVDGSDDPVDGAEDPAPEESQPEPSTSQTPSAPVDAKGSNQGDQNDSKGERESKSSPSDDESTTDKGRVPVPAVSNGSASPEHTETPRPRTVLVTERGPSPLGWVLLVAGLICVGAAGVFYVRRRPFDKTVGSEFVETSLVETPLGDDGMGLVDQPDALDAAPPAVVAPEFDTAEFDAVPAGVPDSQGPDTEEMHIVPLGVDVVPSPDAVDPEAPKR